MNTRFVIILIAVIALALIVMQAIQANSLLPLLAGVVLAMAVIVLALRAVSTPVVKIAESMRLSREDQYRHTQEMARHGVLFVNRGYIPLPQQPAQIEAPQPEPEPVDPRHEYLVALALLTVRTPKYGPESIKLITAEEAQAAGGKFADRNNWVSASKYGQEKNLLYVQKGGRDSEQGLKIKTGTAIDLIETLRQRNPLLDSAVAALPEAHGG